MIHQYKSNGYNIVMDVCSGAVHVVDDITYDVIAVYEENNEVYFSVHVMGSRKKDSGTFRARFFEKGTKERDGDGHYRGSIKATNFFSNAVSQSGTKAVNAINQTFTKEVQKIIDSKKEEVKI